MDWYIKYNTRCTDELRLPKCHRYKNCLKLISTEKKKKKENPRKTLNDDKFNILVNFGTQ